jgi:hypothetical protein
MADSAAHLVDRVFPQLPVRQWVISLPFTLRFRLAYDAGLGGQVLDIFVQVVFGSTVTRRRAGFPASRRKVRCASVTFIQRFGDALNLNVHFHMLALDGVYAEDNEGRVKFHRVPPPSDAEVARVAEHVHRRVGRLLKQRGLQTPADGDPCDEFQNSQPLLAELYGASISGRVASGPRAGCRTAKIGDAVDLEDMAAPSIPRCATIAAFSVHANVCIPGRTACGWSVCAVTPAGRR